MKFSLLVIALLCIGGVVAIDVSNRIPESMSTGRSETLFFGFRAEKNWSHQKVFFNLSGTDDVLFNGCNRTYYDEFSIDYKAQKNLRIPVLFSKPGQYVLTWTVGNYKYNLTNSTTITVGGNEKKIESFCPKRVGNRDRWGIGQFDVVKQRLANTSRRFAVW